MEPEIEGLISEGWKPRIRTRKDRRYITLRKGNKEKSLGPYTDELWEKVRPVEPWATPSQLSELENRILEIEELQRGLNPDLLDKRISKIEKAQRKSDPYLLEKRIKQLDKSQQEANKNYNKLRADMEESKESYTSIFGLLKDISGAFAILSEALVESAERRLQGDETCIHIKNSGFCLHYYYTYDKVEELDYLKPVGYTNQNGKRVYHINVREHPIICSACPEYESKG